ncbi:N5,N10-methylene tetrahydromethanopterin reductase [Kineosporia sp. NBRC 101677]|uniref:LLM class flavin-dependent oxidoreductase n=1 Tax=Kineosporia sp. NBRC 101677 TaxID=3032197 RepID=UPI0024A19EED|nr:LLM class flavin-dependent oxidoreductase [Kineosporia sp. NBRC 101677]GLY20053.1 N5,N10-methylene tetrahydromethanopterin reductase [Kineosporia sp. NBRC 101677]
MSHAFRFGLAAAPFGLGTTGFTSAHDWVQTARRAEDLGFSTLLVPDGPSRFSAFQVLAAAAAVTEHLRLGTLVVPVPMHAPGVIAWETASLDHFSGGRFELGIGAGHPANASGSEQLGMTYPSAAERLRLVATTIDEVTRLAEQAPVRPVQQPRPPIMVAGSGDRLLALAARQADIIHLAVATEGALKEKVALIRHSAGERFERIKLAVSIFYIGGGDGPEWLVRYGIRPDVEHISAIRTDDTGEVVDRLRRWREELGISYFVAGPSTLEAIAPVIDRLAGT